MSKILKETIKREVLSILPYSVPVEFDGVKLNQNEGPLDVAMEIKEEIFLRLSQRAWNRYPASPPTTLIRKIAGYTGFPLQGIMAGNGSNELIQTLILGCCNSGDTLLTVRPTFPVYRRVADVMGVRTIEVPLREDFSFDVPAIIAQSAQAKLIILACPNNPTGTVLALEDIQHIAENTGALLVMDEAYFEFYGQSAQGLLDTYQNLVVLRTFSKALQAAGVRLGYLLGSGELVEQLQKIKLPFSMGLFQQVAGEVMLEMQSREWLQQNIQQTIKERERVMAELLKIEAIQPVPSQANFILFGCTTCDTEELFRRLQKKGILLRNYGQGALPGMLRVSIGTAVENNLFLKALQDCLAEVQTGGVE